MNINKVKSNEKGFTMVELLVASVLATGVVLGSFIFVDSIKDKSAIKEHTKTLSLIYQNVSTVFKTQKAENGLSDTYVEAGLYPLHLLDVNGKPKTPNGGEIKLTNYDSVGLTIHYNKVRQDFCTQIIKEQKKTGWTKYGASDVPNAGGPSGSTDIWATKTYRDNGQFSDFAETCDIKSTWVNLAFMREGF